MDKNRPVISWIIRHKPNNEPKFHQIERFLGAGRSTIAVVIILSKGCCLWIGLNIFKINYLNGRRGLLLEKIIFTTIINDKNKNIIKKISML